jgi:hypothetical protein
MAAASDVDEAVDPWPQKTAVRLWETGGRTDRYDQRLDHAWSKMLRGMGRACRVRADERD